MPETHQYEMELVNGQWVYVHHYISPKITVDAKVEEGQQKGDLNDIKKIYSTEPDKWIIFVFDNNITAPSTVMQTFWSLEAGQNANEVREKLSKKSYMIGEPLTHVQWVDELTPKEIRELTTDEVDAEDELKFEEETQKIYQEFDELMQLPEEELRHRIVEQLEQHRQALMFIDENPDTVVT